MSSSTAPYRWSAKTPAKTGRWWFLESEDHEPRIVRVWRQAGDLEWSYRHGRGAEDIDFCLNAKGALWAGPIPLPAPQLEPLEDTQS